MTGLYKLIVVETKFFFRDPAAWISTVLLPTLILVVLGMIPALRRPEDVFGGQRFIDIFAPSLVVITLAMLGANILPIRLTTYRERGVLRRLSTTPVNPATLLVAQLMINMVIAVSAIVLLITVGNLAFGVPLPQHPLGFITTFLLGMASLFALGLLAAAVAPTARTGSALVALVFMLVMFLGGFYLPRIFLPDLLQRIGAYTPPGVQALLDAWMGAAPQPMHLLGMAVITVIAGGAAARLFRWE
jgi:ABC-2 type transport system permease protein